jgi:hypothetical protein
MAGGLKLMLLAVPLLLFPLIEKRENKLLKLMLPMAELKLACKPTLL